jgi:hypothetical protein
VSPCAGHPEPYDALMDNLGSDAPIALRAARDMCGACPDMVSCLARNADEDWARAVLGRDHFETRRQHRAEAA